MIKKPVIKIGYLPITHAAPLLIEEAYDETEYKIERIKFSTWPDLMDALNSGRIDGASVLIELAMKAHEKGVDLNALALGHEEGNVVVARNDITKVSDLKNETIAIPHTYSTHYLLIDQLLKQNNLSQKDVNIIELPPSEMPAALAEKRIASYIVAEPFGAIALDLEIGHVLSFSEDILENAYCCVLVFRNNFVKENKEVVQTFMNDYSKSGEIAHMKDDRLYKALNDHLPVERKVLEVSLEWIKYDSLALEENKYNQLVGYLAEVELLQDIPTYNEFVDNGFMAEDLK